MKLNADDALGLGRSNSYGVWNSGPSGDISTNPTHASRRIYEGYAKVHAPPPDRVLDLHAPVFTMGSCFAREIEAALRAKGGNVVSMDMARMDRPEFRDANGKIRNGFFHRFTPRALWHEFKIAFDELPSWDPERSLLFPYGEVFVDFNYWSVAGFDESLAAHRVRRALAKEFVRKVTESELVILTLGLNESWLHKPSGFHCNRINPKVLARRADEFELHFLDYPETLFCLEDIRRMLKAYHRTGDFVLVVTVSPVPLTMTFSGTDVIIANERSKAILRAAADTFCNGAPDVRYFPSYELVRFSAPELAWRPDRVHVQGPMVQHVVDTFCEAYFASASPG